MKTGKSAFIAVLCAVISAAGSVRAADESASPSEAKEGEIVGFPSSTGNLREAGLSLSLGPMMQCVAGQIGMVATGGAKANCNLEFREPSMSCPMTQTKVNSLNEFVKTGTDALGACEIQANVAAQQISCLSDSANALRAQLGLFNDAFDKEMNRFQDDMQKIEEVKNDRANQLKQATELLTGRAASGTPGLKQVQANLEQLTQQMEQDIQQFESVNNTINQMEQSLKEQKESRVMSLATKCFQEETNSRFVCNPNAGRSRGGSAAENGGTPTSALGFVTCRVEQNEFIGPTGQIESGGAVEDRAANKKARLQALLNEIFSLTPKTSVIPSSEDELKASVQDTPLILSAAEMEAKFGDRLAEFDSVRVDSDGKQRRFSVRNFVSLAYGGCFAKGSVTVGLESQRSNSAIGIAQFGIREKRDQSVTRFNELINRYNQEFQKSKTALTGRPTVVKTFQCAMNTPQGRLACLKGFRNATTNFLNADPTSNPIGLSEIKLKSIASDARAAANSEIRVVCGSLNACIANLESAHKSLEENMNQVEAFRVKYAQTAFSTTNSFVTRMATQMSGQSKSLQDAIAALNAKVLGPLNVDGLEPELLDRKQLGRDEKGLPTLNGATGGDIIGSQMTPPMLDLARNPFTSASKSLGEAASKARAEKGQFEKFKSDILAQAQDCKDNDIEKALEALQSHITVAGNCGNANQCNEEKVSKLMQTYQGIDSGAMGKNAALYATLDGQLLGLCNTAIQKSTEKTKILEHRAELEKELEACQKKYKDPKDFENQCKGTKDEIAEIRKKLDTAVPTGESATACSMIANETLKFDMDRVKKASGQSGAGVAN